MAIFEQLKGPLLDRELNTNSSLVGSPVSSLHRALGINDGLREFADLTECFQRSASIVVTSTASEYLLLSSGVLAGSTDYTRLSAQGPEYLLLSSGSTRTIVTWLSGEDAFPQRPIMFRNRQDPGWAMTSTTPTTPTGYYIRPDGGDLWLGLDRVPRVGSSQLGAVSVPYVARPPQLTSSGDVPFTLSTATRTDLILYHQAFPHYAAYKILPMLGDEQGAQTQLQQFMGYVTRYLQNARPKGGTVIQLARNYLRLARGGRRGRFDRAGSLIPPSQWS
jgi:hypothetical protein